MQIVRPIKVQEMIGEFLQAELHSSRFREGSLKALKMLGFDQKLLENPDYSNPNENDKRAKVLGLCRGWPDQNLFTNFPNDTEWSLVELSQEELEGCYRLKSSPDMADGERRLSSTAEKFKLGEQIRNVNPIVVGQIVEAIEHKRTLPPLILVGQNFEGKKVLIEGHSRSIAYSSVESSYLSQGIPAIIGLSSEMSAWSYY